MSLYLRIVFRYIQKNFGVFTIGVLGSFLGIFLASNFLIPWWYTQKPVEYVGIMGNFTLADLPVQIQNDLSVGLTKINKDGTASPSAAIHWVATDSGKTFIFYLRQDLKWQDGKVFTAKTINYNLADVKIVPVDDYTVRFELTQPFAALPTLTSQPLFRPGLVGLGNTKVKNIKMNGRFLQMITVESPKKNTVYRFYPTNKMLVLGFAQGEFQKGEISLDTVPALINVSKEERTDYSKQVIAFFNTRGDLGNKDFRRALMYGMPSTFSSGEISDGPIPKSSWAYNRDLKHYNQNFETAKKLLSISSASQSANITISTIPSLLTTAHEMASNWEKVGVKTSTEVVDSQPEDFDVFVTLVEIPADPDQYSLWHSTSNFNISGYKSPKIDKLLEEGRQSIDLKIRKEKYLEFQRAITEEIPAAFLFFPKVYTFSRN